MSRNNGTSSAPLSSLAAAAAKLSVTTPRKADGKGVTKGVYTPKKKDSPNGVRPREHRAKEGNRDTNHYESSHKANPKSKHERKKKDMSSKSSDGKSSRKNTSSINPKFEFCLNGSDSNESSEHEQPDNHRRGDKSSKAFQKNYRSPAPQHNCGKGPSKFSRHSAQKKDQNKANMNGKIIDVNVSRRLIGHALGKRIPTSNQKRSKNFGGILNTNKQASFALKREKNIQSPSTKIQREKAESPSPSETPSGPTLIPSSQLNGPIKVTEMRRWADDDDDDY